MVKMIKKINITCKSGELIPIDQLKSFQGDLKIITDEQLTKLKDSIVKYGFSFPIFVWGKKILDGHQRLKAITSLISDGYEIEDYSLPVVQIQAGSEQEAAEKLLLINSRYATMTQDGFDIFLADFSIDIEEFGPFLEIPEIDMQLPEFEPGTIDDQGKLDQLEPKIIECPNCGEKFDVRKQS